MQMKGGLDPNLWLGFHFVEREGGRKTWHPDKLIEPPYRFITNEKK
jgi:hypothetical protein